MLVDARDGWLVWRFVLLVWVVDARESGRTSELRDWMITASGAREVPFTRQAVWQALTAPIPYCPVCDVSYVFAQGAAGKGASTMGPGTRFACVPGRLNGAPPPDAIRGEVVEWDPRRCIATRLERSPESWQTRIELADAAGGSTAVTVTVAHEPGAGGRLLHALRRKSMQRLVQQTVDSELAKLPEHITFKPENDGRSKPVVRRASSVEQERAGYWVVHLRGEVDTPALDRLELRRRLEELPVQAIDVHELTYIDSSAFPSIRKWAKRSSQSGGRPVIRGESDYFDQMLAVMGLASVFERER